MFEYHHLVQFYETDLMGIVHHSNYLKYFEEARVAWAHKMGIIDYQKPESASFFAVVETRVKHLKPALFGDQLKILVQARIKGARIFFEYKAFRGPVIVAEAKTEHVSLDKDLKLMKPPQSLREIMEKSVWTETWLSSL